MEPSINIVIIANLLSAVQAIYFVIILLTIKTGAKYTNKLLAAFLLIIAAISISDVFQQTYFTFSTSLFSAIKTPCMLLLGPLFYLYVKAWSRPRFIFRVFELWHFIPFVLSAISTVVFFQNEEAHKYGLLERLISLQGFLYLLASNYEYLRFQKNMKMSIPTDNARRLQWIKRIVLMATVLIGLVFVKKIFRISILRETEPFMYPLFVYAMGYMAVKQQRLPAEFDSDSPQIKYAKSGLASGQKQEYLQRLQRSMEIDKLYHESDLTLQKLAQHLDISPNHISQLLNDDLEQNFFDFINRYRIEEVKKELTNPTKSYLTIYALALDAGFNSKGAFNTAFKKHTGITPSQYKSRNSPVHSS